MQQLNVKFVQGKGGSIKVWGTQEDVLCKKHSPTLLRVLTVGGLAFYQRFGVFRLLEYF